PIRVAALPEPLDSLSAEGCAGCHPAIYAEWRTTLHRRAWDDPYFQVDRHFDGDQQVCLNCHTPFARQQPQRVLGFRDRARWEPILAPNPDYDPALRHEGVTCLVCHLDPEQGVILGPAAAPEAPHPSRAWRDPNRVCLRCHRVENRSWDARFRIPPCGTVAEIRAAGGEVACVPCHMPETRRPWAEGGRLRRGHRHLWRGGHDPEQVRRALSVSLRELAPPAPGERLFALTLRNTGAAHALPTGTPDRHLSATFRLLDAAGRPLRERTHRLRRTILWRPFIVDLWDTRLLHGQSRTYAFRFPSGGRRPAAALEVVVRYHLLGEHRRARIGYRPARPIAYEVWRRRIDLRLPPG
ncbi:MAG: hypothetical protein D6739_03945, partial [Nitrospirae bacterium]